MSTRPVGALKVAEEPKGKTMQRMKLASSLILTASTLVLSIQGCNPGSTLQQLPDQGGGQGTSGDTGGDTGAGTTGGTTGVNTGLPPATGGTTPVGPSTGGAPVDNTGGTTTVTGATGGHVTVATGGHVTTNTGGAKPTGGTTNDVIPTGGYNPGLPTGGNGIIIPTGGAPPGAGGSTATGSCTTNTGKTVTFNTSGKACGAMTGWAFVALGATDTVSVPTCGSPAVAITATTACATTTNWPTTGICVTGSVPTNPSPYTSWGINVGANATDPSGSGLGQAFSNVAISATGAPTGATFRYIVSVGTTDYCAAATLGTAVTLSTFNTMCYDSPPDGKAYTGTGSDITGVQLQIVPGTAAITVTSMCLTGITFS